MRGWLRRRRFWAVVVGVALTVALSFGCTPIRVGTGFTAKGLCSLVFVSGMDEARAQRLGVDPVVAPLRWFSASAVDRERREVSTRSFGVLRAHAVFRDGVGCTLLHESTAESLRGSWTPRSPGQPPAPLPVDAGPADREAVDRAVAEAFREPPEGAPRNTLAVVVLRDGALLAERYAAGIGADTPLPGWSMTKSVFVALAGVLAGQGKLDVRAPAPVTEWRGAGDPRRAITPDHLMRMSSGLAIPETNSGYDAVSRMLFLEADMAAFAARASLDAEPGTRWAYTSGNTVLLARLIRDAVGGRLADEVAFAHRELFGPLGVTTAVVEPDEAGTLVGSSLMLASARDWARLGELYRRDGEWNGRRILPAGWMSYARSPTPGAPRRGYGAGFWLNPGADGRPETRRWPSLPPDTFAALGFQGQRTFVIPSRRLVVVRMGLSPRGAQDGAEELARAVIAAAGR